MKDRAPSPSPVGNERWPKGTPAAARNDRGAAVPAIIFSAAAPYVDAVVEELRAALSADRIARVGAETVAVYQPHLDVATVATLCRDRPVVFVRHLMRATQHLPVPETIHDASAIAEEASALRELAEGKQSVSLQVWNDPATHGAIRADELRRRVSERWQSLGWSVSRGGADLALGVCVTPGGAFLGLTARDDALTDWPGGRVGLAHRPDQISRSALKLEELFTVYPLALATGGDALDLGASPGGWTNVLRRVGMRVWAVDPADLDQRLASDPGIHHVRTTAGRFLGETRQTFDLVVNDMRMTADLSAKLMVEASRLLRPEGLAIMTVKLGQEAPRDTVLDALRVLDQTYAILFARHLFHNRHEVTVVARRR